MKKASELQLHALTEDEYAQHPANRAGTAFVKTVRNHTSLSAEDAMRLLEFFLQYWDATTEEELRERYRLSRSPEGKRLAKELAQKMRTSAKGAKERLPN